jgi:hypothetical protein
MEQQHGAASTCAFCGTDKTPKWCKDWGERLTTSPLLLCNPCGLLHNQRRVPGRVPAPPTDETKEGTAVATKPKRRNAETRGEPGEREDSSEKGNDDDNNEKDHRCLTRHRNQNGAPSPPSTLPPRNRCVAIAPPGKKLKKEAAGHELGSIQNERPPRFEGGGDDDGFPDDAVPVVLGPHFAAAASGSTSRVLRYVSYTEVQSTLPDGRRTRLFYLVAENGACLDESPTSSAMRHLAAVYGEETKESVTHYKYSVSPEVMRVAMDRAGRPFASPPRRFKTAALVRAWLEAVVRKSIGAHPSIVRAVMAAAHTREMFINRACAVRFSVVRGNSAPDSPDANSTDGDSDSAGACNEVLNLKPWAAVATTATSPAMTVPSTMTAAVAAMTASDAPKTTAFEAGIHSRSAKGNTTIADATALAA